MPHSSFWASLRTPFFFAFLLSMLNSAPASSRSLRHTTKRAAFQSEGWKRSSGGPYAHSAYDNGTLSPGVWGGRIRSAAQSYVSVSSRRKYWLMRSEKAPRRHLGGSPFGEPVRDLLVIEVALAVSQVENAEKSAVIPSPMRMSIGDRGILGGTVCRRQMGGPYKARCA